MKVKKRILLITPFFSPNLGGVETHLDDLCELLIAKNFQVTVITYQPLTMIVDAKPFEKKGRLTIHRVSWFRGNIFPGFEKLLPMFNFLYLTPRLLLQTFIFMLTNSNKIDIVHAYGLNAAFIARILKFFFHKRTVVSTEALYDYRESGLFTTVVRFVLTGCDEILAQSDASKEEMIRINIDPEKIKVFYHWINQNNFKPKNKAAMKKKLGWENKFTVLYVCRLIPGKGIGLFLDVASQTKKDIAFKVIGDNGPELPKVVEAVKNNQKLEYLGPVLHKDLPAYYAAADILVYPSLYVEDMSYSLLEALSCGTPVINTNKGSGLYQLDGSIAYIVKPKAHEIRNKIEYLYSHKARWWEMVKRAPIFTKKFGPRMAKTIIDSYQQVV